MILVSTNSLCIIDLLLLFHIHNSSCTYLVGRAAIPLHRFTPGTVYNLSFDLYDSGEVVKRKVKGQINIRLSVSWKGQRQLFFNALKTQEEFRVNFEHKKDYDFAEYTVQGYDDQREYNLRTILAYADELLQYRTIFISMYEGIKTVIFWRGHYDVTLLFCIKVKLPLHSLVMLSCGIVITEFPKYTVSVFFASIAWLMLGLLGINYQRPSLWHRPPLFKNLLLRLLTGGCRPTTIDPMEHNEEDEIFMKSRSATVERTKELSEEFWNGVRDDFHELDDTKMKILYKDAVKKPMRLELFKNKLFPMQQRMATMVYYLRLISETFKWNHVYVLLVFRIHIQFFSQKFSGF